MLHLECQVVVTRNGSPGNVVVDLVTIFPASLLRCELLKTVLHDRLVSRISRLLQADVRSIRRITFVGFALPAVPASWVRALRHLGAAG